MPYKIEAYTDIGRKIENQDSYCVRTASAAIGDVIMAVLCDGMGGADDGAVASEGTIEVLEEWFAKQLPSILATEQLTEEKLEKLLHTDLEQVLKKRNQDLIAHGEKSGKNMGTTVSCILIIGNQGYIIHVGDSRIYCLNKGGIKQLTVDHSFVAGEVRQGRMTPKQAKKDPRRNQLTQCVGIRGDIYPQFISFASTGHQAFLLCSDGFVHENEEKKIWRKLKPGKMRSELSIRQQLKELTENAKKRGENDNITTVMVVMDF